MTNVRNAIILIMFMVLWGCSTANDKTVVLDANGKHPSGWAVANTGGKHPVSFMSAPDTCKECHGTDLKGGVSNVSCFSADRSGITCHAQGPSGHPAGWSSPAAHGSHAKAAAVGVDGMAFCKNCHGADYRGAGASQKDCLRCHTTAPHPPKPWFGGTYTHKSTDTSNAPACAGCHTNRANLSPAGVAALSATAIIGTTGCFNNTLCHGVMGHSSDPQPWSSSANHGARAVSEPSSGGNTGLAVCQQCHGSDFSGGTALKSCFPCHTVNAPHPKRADWTLKAGALSHVNAGEGNAPVCASCHNSGTKNLSEPYLTRFASSPAGSFTGTPPNCYNASMCHGDVRKTSNCDACHSTANTNPFKSMAGATATSDAKVGAHVKHLSAATQTTVYSANIACSECHAVPASPLSSGTHRNGANTITFGTLAKTGSLLPTYTPATGVCANTYCHGTTLTGGGSNKAPVWNQGDYLTAGCATCHGYPPTTVRNGAAAHASNSACSGCHSHVNATNNGFTTSGVILHINGTVEATGGGHAVPNYNHQSAGTGASCIVSGCHALGTATSVYPAASGAPDCRGCHKKASPGTGTGTAGSCSSCHGSATASAATAGRPTGTASAFPDKTGQHSRGDHNNVACTVCHVLGASAGTGATVNHGPGNRGTNPNVVGPAFTNGITLSGGTKGTSPAVSCDHNIVGGGCGSGEGVRTW